MLINLIFWSAIRNYLSTSSNKKQIKEDGFQHSFIN